jgi:hypothetical protein
MARGLGEVRRWWRAKKGTDLAQDVFASYRLLRQQSSGRREQDRVHLELYSNLDVAGHGFTALTLGDRRRARYNLCSSIVDTAASVIAQQRPKPMYLTAEGDFGMQRQARLRTRVLEGQLYDTGAYDLGPQVFVDGAVMGTGAVYGYLDSDGHPKLERCAPHELYVDAEEAIYGQPRTIYRVRLVSREVLAELYPKLDGKIQAAESGGDKERRDLFLPQHSGQNQVVTVEAWRLPSTPTSKDGRHVLCVSSVCLVDEPYTDDAFPFAFFRWKRRPMGFWGMGLVEETRDAQWRINRLVQRVNDLSDLGSNMHVFVQGNADFRAEQLSNAPCKIYRINGPAPQFLSVNAVPTELFQQIAQIRDEAFSMVGISTMMAEGKKPSGLDSGAAQRAHDDILSRRHIMNAKAYESFYMDIVKLLERLNAKAAEDPTYRVSARTTRGRAQLVKQVKWSDISLPENKYRLTMFPTSALPSTPAGKMAAVTEWIQGGFVSRPFAQSLLDFPDLDEAARLELADYDIAMYHVEQLLDGEDVRPHQYHDVALAEDIARKSLLQAEISGADDHTLQRLRDYIDDCQQITEIANSAAPTAVGQGMVPGGQMPPGQAAAALSDAGAGGQAMMQ